MIVYLIQINWLFSFCRNRGHPVLFGRGDTIHRHNGESVQDHILLTPILKPHQEPPLKRDYFHHTIKLRTNYPENISLTSSFNSPTFYFPASPNSILFSLTLNFHCVHEGGTVKKNQKQTGSLKNL